MCLLKKPTGRFCYSKHIRSAHLESLLNMPRLHICERSLLSEEVQFVDNEVELVYETPVFEILGDVYVCSNCGSRLTEIPAYNRFYCENCGLHY
jgi:hypothetical protein